MNTHQLTAAIDNLLTYLNGPSILYRVMSILREVYTGKSEFINRQLPLVFQVRLGLQYSTDWSFLNTSYQKLDVSYEQTVTELARLQNSDIFRSLSSIEQAVTRFNSETRTTDLKNAQILQSLISHFRTTYETYLNSVSLENKKEALTSLSELSELLNYSIRSTVGTLIAVKSSLDNLYVSSDTRQRMTLQLSTPTDLPRFAAKLSAIADIYDELCDLIGVSKIDFPLKIIKIESGSVFADLLGYPKIIDLLVDLIKGGTKFLHRRFTQEGKLEAFPRKVEAIESVLDLREKLRSAGVATNNMDEAINKSAFIIATELHTLLAGEPEVVINGEELTVGASYRKAYLESGERFLLTEGNVASNNDKDNI